MRVLVAVDDPILAMAVAGFLKKGELAVECADDGKVALDRLRGEPFDILVTGRRLPRVDGIALIRRVRRSVRPSPFIIMITADSSDDARSHALDSGADDFLSTPVTSEIILSCVRNGLARRGQPAPRVATGTTASRAAAEEPRPPFVGVVIASSSGGPLALMRLVRTLPESGRAAYFVVQHAPHWMLDTLARRLQAETRLQVRLGEDGLRSVPGEVYIAPGDHHLCLLPGSLSMRLSLEPPENYVRPAADPLFRSAAAAFGRFCVGVVLTGMGRDGTLGAEHLVRAGGSVLAQDPDSAIAPSMPRTAIEAGVTKDIVGLDRMGDRIAREIDALARDL